jgi:serine palmitoyltransferase
LRDFIGYLFFPNHYKHLRTVDGYAPITSGFDTFYHRRLYTRTKDCWSRPVTGVPSRTIQVLERYSNDYNQTYVYTGKTTEMLNLSSYNYLGFAQSEGLCADAVEQAIATHGVSSCSSVMEVGMTKLYKDCCELVAGYIGHEAAMLYSMGFATNSTTIPALIGKGGLIISDELNHASLVFAARLSGANIKVFKHNGWSF